MRKSLMEKRPAYCLLLPDVASPLIGGAQLQDLLAEIVAAGIEMVGADRGAVYLYDAERDRLTVGYARGFSSEYLDFLCAVFREVPGSRALRQPVPVYIRDAWHDPEARALWEAARKEGFRSYLVLPLLYEGTAIGALVLYHNDLKEYTPEEIQAAQSLANQASLAVVHTSLARKADRWREVLSAFQEIDAQILAAGDLERVLLSIADVLQRTLGISTLYIGLYDPVQDEVHFPILVDRGEKQPPLRRKLSEDAGLAGWVIRTGQPLWVHDFREEAQNLPVPPIQMGEPTRSLVVLPLRVQDRVVGVLSVQSYTPHAFGKEDRLLLEGFAAQAAIAIENVRLLQEILRRQAQAWVLREVMLAAASTLDFDQVLQRAIHALRSALQVEFLAVMLPDESGAGLRIHPSQIGYDIQVEQFRLPLDGSVCGRVFQTGKAMLIGDVREAPVYYEGYPEVRSELCVPIRAGAEVIGVLNVESREVNAFTEEDLAFFSAIAGQLGIALENARLYQAEQRRRKEAESLYRAALAITTALDPEEVLGRILTELYHVVPYDSASVQLLREGKLEIIAGRGFPNIGEILGVTIDPTLDDSPNGQVIRMRAPLILEDAPALYERFRQPPHTAANIRAWMGVPLLYGDRVIGMLTLDKQEPGFYTAEHARLAVAFAGQAAIALENARLYQELEQRSAELDAALQRLQDLDRLREQMIQNVSHELRTPLTIIQGYVELLLGGDLGPLQPPQRSALQVVYERTQTLAQLIGNLTALRVIRPERMVMQPVALPGLVYQLVEQYGYRAEKAGIRIALHIPTDLPMVLADREYLFLALSQLLDNAIKFSPQGGTVSIRAWSEEEWVKITVRDEGIGIPEEHLGHIFERFYQVDGSTTRRFGGMGIGLSLVWEIMQAHQGSVSVESTEGKGSTFTLAFRRAGV